MFFAAANNMMIAASAAQIAHLDCLRPATSATLTTATPPTTQSRDTSSSIGHLEQPHGFSKPVIDAAVRLQRHAPAPVPRARRHTQRSRLHKYQACASCSSTTPHLGGPASKLLPVSVLRQRISIQTPTCSAEPTRLATSSPALLPALINLSTSPSPPCATVSSSRSSHSNMHAVVS
ncbi:hypothetical protein LMH87_003049 [Akanthomyces muscarius]|uniref:Uncharacterized protein n=1 Tax=Akanthomyces muscarius TaxID=2231603 RepID=A0A9W8UJ58_AKAMU|nr:hypothetical protein LMH87_003049 [Akanthomyces muscarius]KAJ4148585.1 hypothetical protein LMH87_003049 [Akanthomyces muscarius]